MSFLKNSRVMQLVLALAVVAMMSACGMDHSPVASADDADRIAPDPVSAPAAKKPADSGTTEEETTTDKGSKITKFKGASRYSVGGK